MSVAIDPPELDYDSATPVYVQVADWIAGMIASGEIAPGRPLPSEAQIMGGTGIARHTARKAVAVLRDRGLVVTTPGKGSYAAQSRDVGRP